MQDASFITGLLFVDIGNSLFLVMVSIYLFRQTQKKFSEDKLHAYHQKTLINRFKYIIS
jgi:hypothetical protein